MEILWFQIGFINILREWEAKMIVRALKVVFFFLFSFFFDLKVEIRVVVVVLLKGPLVKPC